MSDQEKHSYQLPNNKHQPLQTSGVGTDNTSSQDESLLSPLQRARLYHTHIHQDQLSQTDIAKKYQKSLAYVSNTLRLLKLPEIVQEGVESGAITQGHARALLSIPAKQEVVSLYREILVYSLSVRAVEKRARTMKKKKMK